MSKYNINTDKLNDIEQLQKGWFGDGHGEVINKDYIKKLRHTLPDIHNQPDIFPLSDGSMQLEYSFFGDRLYIEFEIISLDKLKAFIQKLGEEETFEIDFKATEIDKVVNKYWKAVLERS